MINLPSFSLKQYVLRKQELAKHKNVKSSGFTIVELLIVIVVIAILAALVIVTFNGMQQRARNAQRITVAKEYQKIFNLYLQSENKYPPGSAGTTGVCLGEGYPTNWDATPEGDCHATNNIKHEVAGYGGELRKVSSSLPDFNKTPIVDSGITYLGILFRAADTIDSKATTPTLRYFLEGVNQDCELSPVATGTSQPYVTTGNPKNSGTIGTSVTLCVIVLPEVG